MKIINFLGLFIFYSCCGTTIFAQSISNDQKPFSHSFDSNGFVFVSGQIASKTLSANKSCFKEEVHEVIQSISGILRKSELTLNNVVNVTVYLKNIKQFDAFNSVYMEYFQSPFPARTCVVVKDLVRHANIEITIVAARE